MKTLTIMLVAFCLEGVSVAQTVKQGDPNALSAAPTEFHSPMIIDTVFAPADPSLWKSDEWTPAKPKPWKNGVFTTAEYFDLGKYSCDGLSIRNGSSRNGSWGSGLMMSVKDKGGKVHIDIEAHLTNPGYVPDKLVTLRFDVINGDEIVAKTMINIKVNQHWLKKEEESGKHGQMVLASDSLKKNPITKLRITLTTKDY